MTQSGTPSIGCADAATPGHGIAAPGHRLPPSTRVGAVRLQVADLSRSEAFYHRVLGLETLARTAGRLALRAPGGGEALIELVEHQGARPTPPGGRIGLFHYAVLLPSRAALAALLIHAREIGLPLGMSDHLVSESLYFSDCDGLGIEVYADRPRSDWKWADGQLVMTTLPLDVGSMLTEVGDDSFGGVPAETCIGHVHLNVRDLGEAAGFYHEALGLDKVVWNYPGALFLSAGGYHHHLGLNTWVAGAPVAGPHDARLLSWTLVLEDAEAVQRAAESVESAGHEVMQDAGRFLALDRWGTAVELISAE